MKKILMLVAVISIANMLYAQSEKYTAAMKKNISLLDSAMAKGNAAELANNFERIGDAEKTQWLPYYYASYCTILASYSNQDKGKTDAMADKAQQLINKSEQLAGRDNSETAVIESMIASSRLMVDPQNRYMQYGPIAAGYIVKAKELDPTNPRPVYLEGTTKFYTPEAFGGGKVPAKEIFNVALGMFDTFKPAAELYPTWGKSSALYFISLCNQK